MKRPAFTMIELVFVIVVLGILAAMAMPRLDRDLRQEAADSILSDIRYTQHLALMDDMHEFNDPKWQQKFWRIVFSGCGGTKRYYMIGSDTSKDDANNAFFAQTEAALDPVNGKPMFGDAALCGTDGSTAVSDRIFITKKYDIDTVLFTGGCNIGAVNGSGGDHIGFDHLGRPQYGFSTSATPDYASYMNADCKITFSSTNGTIDPFTITIKKETGYAFIDGQPNS